MAQTTFTLTPIGRVVVGQAGFSIVIDETYRAGLRGLDGFSHLNILYWCHHLDAPEYREMVTVNKPYKRGPDHIGVFATRSPARPNPIALTAAQLLGIDHEAGVITVAYIDADPETPVLDLKAYFPAVDRVRDTFVPDWCTDWPAWYEDSATFDWGAVFENAR